MAVVTDEQYLQWLHAQMREAVRETQRLDGVWKQLNAELNDLLDRQGETDIVQRTKVKGQSIALSDALNGGKWWREKAVYLASVLQAELAWKDSGRA
jgi:hypothetical protein